MKKLIVGGNFGDARESSIVNKLSDLLVTHKVNGGSLDDLQNALNLVPDYDFIIWMPNINNEVAKDYPKKKKGSILICSKVINDERTIADAVTRIFKMNANAVITIHLSKYGFAFKLIDALGNLWVDTSDLNDLVQAILKLIEWTKNSIRKNTKLLNLKEQMHHWFHTKKPNRDVVDWLDSVSDQEKLKFLNQDLKPEQKFCDIVKIVAQKIEKERGGRYFGNASTRCSFTFPSKKLDDGILVSGRNMPKDFIKPEDFVYAYEGNNEILYTDSNLKPSVDTPVQIELYKRFPSMRYIIHGHAYIEGAWMTKQYYPCGDLREVDAVFEIIGPWLEDIELELGLFCINLKNHGFLIFGEDLDDLEEFIGVTRFIHRELEEKI